ncbi:hypothetical protein ABK040_004248 [Willaertia magna]
MIKDKIIKDEGKTYEDYIPENIFIKTRKPSFNLYQCIINYDTIPNVYRTKLCKEGLEWESFEEFVKHNVYNKMVEWSYITTYPELDLIKETAPTMAVYVDFLKSLWTYRRFFNTEQLEIVKKRYPHIIAPYTVNNGYTQCVFSFHGKPYKVKGHHIILWIEQGIIILNKDDGSHLNHDKLAWKIRCEDHGVNISRNPCVGPVFEIYSGSQSIVINWKYCNHDPKCEWCGFENPVIVIKDAGIVLDLAEVKKLKDEYLLIQSVKNRENFGNLQDLVNSRADLKMCVFNSNDEVAIIGTPFTLGLLESNPCDTDEKINFLDVDWEYLDVPDFNLSKLNIKEPRIYPNTEPGLQEIEDWGMILYKTNQTEFRKKQRAIKRKRKSEIGPDVE